MEYRSFSHDLIQYGVEWQLLCRYMFRYVVVEAGSICLSFQILQFKEKKPTLFFFILDKRSVQNEN